MFYTDMRIFTTTIFQSSQTGTKTSVTTEVWDSVQCDPLARSADIGRQSPLLFVGLAKHNPLYSNSLPNTDSEHISQYIALICSKVINADSD